MLQSWVIMSVQGSGSRQLLRIDGRRIRAIREQKGLTQLYLASYVGVTTDTISRWENRKYPTIKRENAQKLAEALEVELEEILEREEEPTVPEPDHEGGESTRSRDASTPKLQLQWVKKGQVLVIGLLFVVIMVVLLYLGTGGKKEDVELVTATRTLPSYVAPGSLFPVVVEIGDPGHGTSVIVKETIPRSLTVAGYYPEASPLTLEKGAAHWIVSVPHGGLKFIYVLKVPDKTKMGKKLRFSGEIISKGARNTGVPIEGDVLTLVGPYHWADKDANSIIDDQEMLDAYDTFSQVEVLKPELDELEALWAKGKYKWAIRRMLFFGQQEGKDEGEK